MSNERHEATKHIVTKFVGEFSLPLDDEAALGSIVSVCNPSIVWTDHAFHIQRVGHSAVLGLRKSFNHCNQPLETRIKSLHYTEVGAVVEAIWVGHCKNDIVRPNGQVAVKANGKDFECHVCFVMEIDPLLGITKIDEYYNKTWWDGVRAERYVKMS